MYMCVYIYVCVCVCIYIYIHTHTFVSFWDSIVNQLNVKSIFAPVYATRVHTLIDTRPSFHTRQSSSSLRSTNKHNHANVYQKSCIGRYLNDVVFRAGHVESNGCWNLCSKHRNIHVALTVKCMAKWPTQGHRTCKHAEIETSSNVYVHTHTSNSCLTAHVTWVCSLSNV